MDVKQIVGIWLSDNGYDGLHEKYFECGCKVGDLFPCDMVNDCEAGYFVTPDPESGYDFAIGTTKEEIKA